MSQHRQKKATNPENTVLKLSGPPLVTALHPVLAKSNKRIFYSSKELLHPEFSCQTHTHAHTHTLAG